MNSTSVTPTSSDGFKTLTRRLAKLLAAGALVMTMHSSADAQWVQGTNFDDLSFQFPTGHVAIGFPTPLTYAGSPQFYVIGTSQFDGAITVNNGPLDLLSKLNLRPVGGVSSKMFFYSNNNVNYTTFTNGASTTNIDYTWPNPGVAPVVGQVLTYGAAGQLNWTTPAGGIGGGGTVNFIPRFTPTGVLLGNSVIQDLTSTGAGVIVGGPLGPPTNDVLQVQGNTRIGGVVPGPVLGASTTGIPVILGGVPGIFPPAPNSENTDLLQVIRRNNAYDNSEVDVVLGDNPEGLPDAGGANTPDKFVIGSTPSFGPLAGLFQAGFSFSTASGLALGYGVANLNGLDVGATAAMPGATILPNANVAIGTYAGVNVAPANGLIVSGRTGIGTPAPGNTAEINTGAAAPNNLSGLRLTQFAGMTPGAAAPIQPYYLSINGTGDVIAALAPAGGGGVTGTGTAKQLAVWTGTSAIGNSILWDNGSKIGLSTTTPSSTLSFQFNGTTTPAAQTVGVERTTVSSAPGTPLSITSGACLAGTAGNLSGGDLTLSSGISTGSGSSNIAFQVSPPGTAGATTDNALVTKAYLAGTGKFGIGTYSVSAPPSYDLSFTNSAPKVIGVESFTTGTTTGRSLTVHAGGQTASGTHSGGDLILAGGVSNGGGSSHVQIQASTGSTLNTSIFVDGNTGFVGIDNGTTTPGAALDIGGGDLNVQNNAVVNGNFTVNGTPFTPVAWTVSDARLKKNVQPLQNSLSEIMQLQGVEYDFRVGEIPGVKLQAGHQLGFIAQDLEKVIPAVVRIKDDGYRAVAYTMLIPVLTEALKAQQNEIIAEDSAIVVAHGTIDKLNARLTKLEAIVSSFNHTETGATLNQAGATGVEFFQNNPNPFKDITTISFMVPESVVKAEFVVFNTGSNVEALRIPITMRGNGSLEVSAATLNSGQYLYTIISDGQQAPAKKMTVLK